MLKEGLSREAEMRNWNVQHSPTPEEIADLKAQIKSGRLRVARKDRHTLTITEGPATRTFEED